MSRISLWVAGARPKTLGAAVSPVLVGTAAASRYGSILPVRALGALVVAVALQVGVNYANDYSDGVRGVDVNRRGPLRLTASGLVSPGAVKRAAVLSFTVGGLVGIALALAVNPWLIVVGALAILAALLYSGGPRPYASSGLGEVSVLLFFGFVATCGSAYVQIEELPALVVAAAVPVGLLACAILLVNNLRDVDTDRQSGKRTLAVRVGPGRTRQLYAGCVAASFLAVLAMAVAAPAALLALLALPLALDPLVRVRRAKDAPTLIGALVGTARLQLMTSLLLAAGLWL